MVLKTTNLVDSTEQPEPAKVNESAVQLLISFNDLIDVIRNKQYEANADYEDTGNKYFDGVCNAYDICATLLTEVIKRS